MEHAEGVADLAKGDRRRGFRGNDRHGINRPHTAREKTDHLLVYVSNLSLTSSQLDYSPKVIAGLAVSG